MFDFDNVSVVIALLSIWSFIIVVKCIIRKGLPSNDNFMKSIFVVMAFYSLYGVVRVTEYALTQDPEFSNDLVMPMSLSVLISFIALLLSVVEFFKSE